MLSDVLGIAIAFVSIILLLSILVTALVQFLQAAFHLRARNLRKGLAELIRNIEAKQAVGSTPISIQKSKELADKVLATPEIALISQPRKSAHAEQATLMDKVMGALMGPGVSWIEADRLKEAAKPILKGPADAEDTDTAGGKAEILAHNFKDAQPLLQSRFKFQIRFLTFGMAFVVAFAFQVSAPRLLLDLSHDSERRNAIVAGADRLLVSAAEDIRRLDDEDAAIEALQVLQVRHPDQRHLIAQASGTGTTRHAIVEELNLALAGSSEKAAILIEYQTLLETLAQEQLGTAREIARTARTQLGEYGIFLWPQQWRFYFENAKIGIKTFKFNAWIGVFITAILLSLGAPFWFEMLRNLVKLRDVLSGKAGTSSKPQDEGGASEKGKQGEGGTSEKDKQGEGGEVKDN